MTDHEAEVFIKLFDESFYTDLPRFKSFFDKGFSVEDLSLFDILAIAELSLIHPTDNFHVESRPDTNTLMIHALLRIKKCCNRELRNAMLERIVELEVAQTLANIVQGDEDAGEERIELKDVRVESIGDDDGLISRFKENVETTYESKYGGYFV